MESTGEESIDMSPMESLPTEILQKILSYLPVPDRVRVERVCKRWKNVSDGRVWRDIQELYLLLPSSKGFYGRYVDPSKKTDEFIIMKDNKVYINCRKREVICSVVSRARDHIKKLIFPVIHVTTGPENLLSIIVTYCTNIESIHLWGIERCDTELFLKLLKNNQQLNAITCRVSDNIIGILPLRDWKLLCLGGVEFAIENQTTPSSKRKLEKKLIALIRNSPSLETFCVRHWTPEISAVISESEHVKNLSFSHWNIAANQILETAFLNRLTRLIVDTVGYRDADQIINSLRHCINLEELRLFYTEGVLPLAVEQAVMVLPKLESLELRASSVTDEILSRLLKFKCLRIKYSDQSITENGLFGMIMSSECLEELAITRMKVTREFFERLVQNIGKRPNLLKIGVHPYIYKKVLEICEGSGVHVMRELDDSVNFQDNWLEI